MKEKKSIIERNGRACGQYWAAKIEPDDGLCSLRKTYGSAPGILAKKHGLSNYCSSIGSTSHVQSVLSHCVGTKLEGGRKDLMCS